jgi:hypothetical protein
VDTEGDFVGALGPGDFGHASGIENQEERPVALPIENNRKQHACTFIVSIRSSDEHGLARIASGLRPNSARARLNIDPHEAVEEIARLPISRAPDHTIWTSHGAAIVDSRKLYGNRANLTFPNAAVCGAERNDIIDQLYLSRLRTGEPVDAVGSLYRY